MADETKNEKTSPVFQLPRALTGAFAEGGTAAVKEEEKPAAPQRQQTLAELVASVMPVGTRSTV